MPSLFRKIRKFSTLGVSEAALSYHLVSCRCYQGRHSTSRHWVKIGSIIKEHYEKFDGFVVLHGTDTMAYTSAAISFMIQNSPIPIIFVGAQRSVDRGSSDAFPNLLTAAIERHRF